MNPKPLQKERMCAEYTSKYLAQLLKSTINGLSPNLAILDENGYILFVNKSWNDFAQKNGIDPNLVSVGTNYLKICDDAKGEGAEEALVFAKSIREVIRGEKEYFGLEYPCDSPEEKRWFVGHITPFPGDCPRRVIVVHEDITQCKLIGEALKESENRYEQLAEQSLTFTWKIDKKGLLTFVSPVGNSVLGYKPEEIVNKMYIYELHIEKGREEFTKKLLTTLDRKEPFMNLQFPVRKQDGNVTFASINGLPIFNNHLELSGYHGSHTDITKQKKSEQKLAIREQRFQSLVENMPNYIVRYDKNLRRIYVNPAWEKASGYSANEVINPQHANNFKININDYYVDKLKKVLNSGTPDKIEFTWKNKKDDTLILEYLLVPEFGEADAITGVLAIGHDLTERRKKETELQQYSERLKDKATKLEDMNTALRVLLDQRARDCQAISDQVLTNMRLLILPYLENIKREAATPSIIRNIEVIQRNFENITSSFVHSFNTEKQKLTTMEVRVADLIHSGMTSKEIADMLNISIRTAEAHRASIRRKLDLSGKKIRLSAFFEGLYKA